MNRTVGIVITVITSCCCGFLAIFLCLFSTIGMVNGSVDLNGTPTPMPQGLGIALICTSVILIVIPIAVGFFTLRKKPAVVAPDLGGPIPPAS